jgi:ferredoxin
MTYIITSLCLRDSACVDVCPVECIVPGKPQDQWPWYYIDPETCIDCGACVPECPYEAIFPQDEVPDNYIARGDEVLSKPVGTPGFGPLTPGEEYGEGGVVNDEGHLVLEDNKGETVVLTSLRVPEEGEEIDLTEDCEFNYRYFGFSYPDMEPLEDESQGGMGYAALEE